MSAMTAQAGWSKRYRDRRKAGLIVIEAEVCEVELVEALLAAKLLDDGDREDRDAINAAVGKLLEMFCEERR